MANIDTLVNNEILPDKPEAGISMDDQVVAKANLPEDAAQLIEAALFCSEEPQPINKLIKLFPEYDSIDKNQVREIVEQIQQFYASSAIELVLVASGYRFQVNQAISQKLNKVWEKKLPKYSRATLEVLALIIYRQPITRGEIEEVRGVAVSSTIIRTLLDHKWIKSMGCKDVPGKPTLWGTTKHFLDYFNLTSIAQMPPLDDLINLDELEKKLSMQTDLPLVNSDNASEKKQKC